MDQNLKLVILDAAAPATERSLDFRIERTKALNAIVSSGAKIRHDGGGRLIVIEATAEAERSLARLLPGARVIGADSAAKESIAGLDSSELLFLEAVKIRTSKTYRDAKQRRKVGDTPEEKDLTSGPDVREEY